MALMEQIAQQLNMLPPDKQNEVLDFILFLQQRVGTVPAQSEDERRQRIKSALDKLTELQTFADITDPVSWERNVRQDRPLPGRDA